MLISYIQKLGYLALWALVTFNYVVNAYDYDIRRELAPNGPLGVTLDYPFAVGNRGTNGRVYNRNWFWSSYLKLEPDVKLEDEQLWKIGRDAAEEMVQDAKRYKILPEKLPRAVGIMAWGNEILIASSQVGKSFFFSPSGPGAPEVKAALGLCQASWRADHPNPRQKEHRNSAKCSEPMMAHLYYSTNPAEPLDKKHAKLGVWYRYNPEAEWYQIDPCGYEGRDWGCREFIERMGVTPMDKTLTPKEYDLTGKVSERAQLQLCGNKRIT